MLEQKQLWKNLGIAAIIAAIVHMIAGLCMAIILRNGLDTAELPQRFAFLTQYTGLWNLGWFSWNLASFAILYFYFCFAEAHIALNKYSYLLRFAVLLTVAGMGIDFCAEAIEMGVLPNLAQMIVFHSGALAATTTETFLALHRTAIMMTGCLSNELYTASAAILVLTTWANYNWLIRLSGVLLVIGGSWLSIAVLLNSVTGMLLSNVLLLPMLILWLVGIAYDSWQKNSSISTAV